MNLRNLNKGQKILLFVFLPVMLIIISIAITIIFDDSNKNDDQLSSSTDAINVEIPDTFAKTETDVNKAYQNAQDKYKRKRKSDFNIGEYISEPDTSYNTPNEEKINNFPTQTEEESSQIKKFQDIKKENEEGEKELHSQIKKRKKTTPRKTQSKIKPEVPQVKEEKMKFHSISLSGESETKTPVQSVTGIKTYVHANQTVYQGAFLKMRIGQEIELKNGQKIPANTFAYGICKIVKERVQIQITQVQVGQKLIACNFTVCDTDGNEGIHIPGSVQRKESKTSTSRGVKKIGSAIGSGVKVVGGGILGDVAEVATEGVIDAVSSGAAKDIQEIKVNLTNNYVLYLKEK
mgnify:FL=1